MKTRSCRFRTSAPGAPLRRFPASRDGNAAAEYALLLAVAAGAITVAALRLSDAVGRSIGANAAVMSMADANGSSGRAGTPLAGAAGVPVRSIPSREDGPANGGGAADAPPTRDADDAHALPPDSVG